MINNSQLPKGNSVNSINPSILQINFVAQNRFSSRCWNLHQHIYKHRNSGVFRKLQAVALNCKHATPLPVCDLTTPACNTAELRRLKWQLNGRIQALNMGHPPHTQCYYILVIRWRVLNSYVHKSDPIDWKLFLSYGIVICNIKYIFGLCPISGTELPKPWQFHK